MIILKFRPKLFFVTSICMKFRETRLKYRDYWYATLDGAQCDVVSLDVFH